MKFKRNPYQHGSLTIEKRKKGPAVWVYRWRETDTDGKQVNRKIVVGSKTTFPNKTNALAAVQGMQLEINKETPAGIYKALSIGQLVIHYRETELADTNPHKTAGTKYVYGQHLDTYILPKWQDYRLQDIRAILVEGWLAELPLAPATGSKTRNILSALYEHAMRYGWATANPIRQVRQSAKRLTEPDVLTVEEITAILARLTDPCRTIAVAVALTGLRRGELFGLQWSDVDFGNAVIHVRRSIVNQVVGSTKTVGSNRPLPMNVELSKALAQWKLTTRYTKPNDWVFASPSSRGEKPYWANTLLTRHIRPAALEAGIGKVIGWHTFRRSFATLLQSSGASVKSTQELMRHASPVMTLGTYAQAVTSDKREAQDRIAAMILPNCETENGTLAA
jgi:integrase